MSYRVVNGKSEVARVPQEELDNAVARPALSPEVLAAIEKNTLENRAYERRMEERRRVYSLVVKKE